MHRKCQQDAPLVRTADLALSQTLTLSLQLSLFSPSLSASDVPDVPSAVSLRCLSHAQSPYHAHPPSSSSFLPPPGDFTLPLSPLQPPPLHHHARILRRAVAPGVHLIHSLLLRINLPPPPPPPPTISLFVSLGSLAARFELVLHQLCQCQKRPTISAKETYYCGAL